jgi:hypothetical protein
MLGAVGDRGLEKIVAVLHIEFEIAWALKNEN